MGKKICSDSKVLNLKMEGKDPRYCCKKCGEKVTKEKWACKPKII